jgi:hypothetical protein
MSVTTCGALYRGPLTPDIAALIRATLAERADADPPTAAPAKNFQRTFTTDGATNRRFRIPFPVIDAAITLLCIATVNYCNATRDL